MANNRRRSNSGGARGGHQKQPRPSNTAGFWGPAEAPDPDEKPAPAVKIRPASDPAAVARSLGDAPLGVSPAVVAHHLAVVYEEAVKAATALAAANGLLADDPWLGDDDDEDD